MKKMTYEKAIQELEKIQADLENNAIPFDQLEEVIQRAATLVGFCKEKIRGNEALLNDLFSNEEAN